jgi:hypothetical protein
MTTDTLTDDIRAAMAHLARRSLRDRGETALLARLDGEDWTVRRLGPDLYVLQLLADGEFLLGVSADDLALATGALRALRDGPPAMHN